MKKIGILLLVLLLVLAGCGEKNDVTTTTTSQTTTTTETVTTTTMMSSESSTTEDRSTSGAESGSVDGSFKGVNLTEDFEAKFSKFKISKDWSFMTASVNETEDTLYFYWDQIQQPPFLMYQYEKVDPSIVFLGNAQWDTVFKNAGVKRIGEEIRNGVKFQYGYSDHFNDAFGFLLYYTYEKGILQGFALVVPVSNETGIEQYKEQLANIVDTVVINEAAVGAAFENSSGMIPTTNAPSSDFSSENSVFGEFDYVSWDELELPVPRGWIEASRTDAGGLTIGYADNSGSGRALLYQKLDVENLNAVQMEQLMDTYASGFGGVKGEKVTINGREYIQVLPKESSQMNFVGYSTYLDGAMYSFMISYIKADQYEENAELIHSIVEAVQFR